MRSSLHGVALLLVLGLGTSLVLGLGTSLGAVAQEPAGTALGVEPDELVETEGDGDYVVREEPQIRRSLADVLARDEFARLRPRPDEEPDQTADFEDETRSTTNRTESGPRTTSSGSADVGAIARGLNFLVLALAATAFVVVIAFILHSVWSTRKEKKLRAEDAQMAAAIEESHAPSESGPETYWSQAEGYASRGDHQRAIRELLLGAMSHLERKGAIRHRKGLTNRDYVRAARGVARDAVVVIVRAFELVYFGRRDATAEMFAECRDAYRRGFGGASP